jgi:hypothetical protein
MAWTIVGLGAWYGVAAVAAVLGLAAERRERGESTASAFGAAMLRLHNRARGAAPWAVPVPRERFVAAD